MWKIAEGLHKAIGYFTPARLFIFIVIIGILVFTIVSNIAGKRDRIEALASMPPASPAVASNLNTSSLNNDYASFPAWVIKKIGIPILLESDWTPTVYPNAKYGAYTVGSGTLSRNTTDLFFGGSASIDLHTSSTIGDATEIKTSFYNIFQKGELVAFEFKWIPAISNYASTRFDVGIEPRTSDIVQGRFRYTEKRRSGSMKRV